MPWDATALAAALTGGCPTDVDPFPLLTLRTADALLDGGLIRLALANQSPRAVEFVMYLHDKLVTMGATPELHKLYNILCRLGFHQLFLLNDDAFRRWRRLLAEFACTTVGRTFLLTEQMCGLPVLFEILKYEPNFMTNFLGNSPPSEEHLLMLLSYYNNMAGPARVQLMNLLQAACETHIGLRKFYFSSLQDVQIAEESSELDMLTVIAHYKYIRKNSLRLNPPDGLTQHINSQFNMGYFRKLFERKVTTGLLLECIIIIPRNETIELLKYLMAEELLAVILSRFQTSNFLIEYKTILLLNFLCIRCQEAFVHYIDLDKRVGESLQALFVKNNTFSIYNAFVEDNLHALVEKSPEMISQYQLVNFYRNGLENDQTIEIFIQQGYTTEEKCRCVFFLDSSLELLGIEPERIRSLQDVIQVSRELSERNPSWPEDQLLHLLYQINGLASERQLPFQLTLVRNLEIAHRNIQRLLVRCRLVPAGWAKVRELEIRPPFEPDRTQAGQYNMRRFKRRCRADDVLFQKVWRYIRGGPGRPTGRAGAQAGAQPNPGPPTRGESFLKEPAAAQPQRQPFQATVRCDPDALLRGRTNGTQPPVARGFTFGQLAGYLGRYFDAKRSAGLLEVRHLVAAIPLENATAAELVAQQHKFLQSPSPVARLYNDINSVRLDCTRELKQLVGKPAGDEKRIQRLQQDINISAELMHVIINFICFKRGLRGHLSSLNNIIPQSFVVNDFNEVIYDVEHTQPQEAQYVAGQNFYCMAAVMEFFNYTDLSEQLGVTDSLIIMQLCEYIIEFQAPQFSGETVTFINHKLNYYLSDTILEWRDIWQHNFIMSNAHVFARKTIITRGAATKQQGNLCQSSILAKLNIRQSRAAWGDGDRSPILRTADLDCTSTENIQAFAAEEEGQHMATDAKTHMQHGHNSMMDSHTMEQLEREIQTVSRSLQELNCRSNSDGDQLGEFQAQLSME